MKTKYLLIAAVTLFTVACSKDMLEKYPQDKINDMNFWNAASEVTMYANQFYSSFTKEYIWQYDNYTDNNAPNNRNAYIWGESVVPVTGGGWGKTDWERIRGCNYALQRVARMARTSELDVAEAELRFFKSYYYLEKVKRFGDIPWFDKDLQTNSEELYKGRDARKVVVANILSDLDYAVQHLPPTSPTDRLTKYAALALKAETCLFEGTFRKYHGLGDFEELLRQAANSCEEIMKTGIFSLYTTGKPNEDYFNLFVQYELKGNPEGILVDRYITNKRMNNDVRKIGEAQTGFTKDFVESYLCKDGLPISLSKLYKGDARFEDEFVDRDPRMAQTVYNSDRPYRIYDDGSVMYKPMPQFDLLFCPTSYNIIKGYSPYEKDRQENQGVIDHFVYRYGLILVSYAEAKAELGECTQGVLDKSINLLRSRVGMPPLMVAVGFVDPNWPKWEVAVSPLINEIRRERRVECCEEAIRFDDLVRWKAGKLLENPKTQYGALDPATASYRVIYPGFERKWNDKLYLYPIPSQEISLNPALKQNHGWE